MLFKLISITQFGVIPPTCPFWRTGHIYWSILVCTFSVKYQIIVHIPLNVLTGWGCVSAITSCRNLDTARTRTSYVVPSERSVSVTDLSSASVEVIFVHKSDPDSRNCTVNPVMFISKSSGHDQKMRMESDVEVRAANKISVLAVCEGKKKPSPVKFRHLKYNLNRQFLSRV